MSPLVLRAFRASDRDFFAALAGDERVVQYVGDGTTWSANRIDERVTLALHDIAPTQDGAVRWFIAECGQEPVGLFVTSRRGSMVEIGYWVAPAHWGRGVAGAMLDAGLIQTATTFGDVAAVARIDPANLASARAVVRRGFRLTGRDDAGLDVYAGA